MNVEDIYTLKPGDVLRHKTKGTVRLVCAVTARPTKWSGLPGGYVTFRILRRSWTNRMFTSRLWRECYMDYEKIGARPDAVEIDMHTEDLCCVPSRHIYDADGVLIYRRERPIK